MEKKIKKKASPLLHPNLKLPLQKFADLAMIRRLVSVGWAHLVTIQDETSVTRGPDWGSARVQHKTRKLGGKTHVPYPNWMCSCYGRVKIVQMFKTSIDNKIDIKMIWINRILTCSASYGMINLIWENEIVYYRDHKGTRPLNCLAKSPRSLFHLFSFPPTF